MGVIGPTLSVLVTCGDLDVARGDTGTIVLVYLQLLCCPACIGEKPIGRGKGVVTIYSDFSIAHQVVSVVNSLQLNCMYKVGWS